MSELGKQLTLRATRSEDEEARKKIEGERAIENNSSMMFRRVARWDRINLVPDHSIDTISREIRSNKQWHVAATTARERRHLLSLFGPALALRLPPVLPRDFFFQINAGGARVIYPLAFFFIGINARSLCSFFLLHFSRRTKDRASQRLLWLEQSRDY